jgi:hypothetical protein
MHLKADEGPTEIVSLKPGHLRTRSSGQSGVKVTRGRYYSARLLVGTTMELGSGPEARRPHGNLRVKAPYFPENFHAR